MALNDFESTFFKTRHMNASKLFIILATLAILCKSYVVQDFSASFTSCSLRMQTKLFLKAGLDRGDRGERGDRNNRHPVKTGTHTYASWKSPDLRSVNFDAREREDVEYEEEYNEGEYEEEDDDDSSNNDVETDPPSPILQWLRKLYESMFFYGLDPAPPSQQSNRKKMMRDAENYDSKKNTSPFFTPSEQRVQRYMTSMRNKDTTKESNRESNSRDEKSNMKSRAQWSEAPRRSNGNTRSENRPTSTEVYSNENQIISKANQYQQVNDSPSIPVVIEKLNMRILDLTEELELIDAEIMTSSKGDQEYPSLLRRKDSILDYIEDLEVELVTAKSRLV